MEIPVLFEDDCFIAVSKPNNMLVHGSYYARNIKSPTLLELLANRFEEKLYPIHRLDHKTSGLILLAKSPEMVTLIQQQFEQETVTKTYYALVRGYTDPVGEIETPVKNANSGKYKEALTLYETLDTVEVDIPVEPYPKSRYSLIKMTPKTGRMHQLRIHANKISHPIIGDHKYGNRHHNRMFETELKLPNLFLHAAEITITHPKTKKELQIKAPFPDFWKTMEIRLGFGQTIGS